jgi:hypothetical protein
VIQKLLRSFALSLAFIVGLAVGIGVMVHLKFSSLSMWQDYKSIRMGMPRRDVVDLVARDNSQVGCGVMFAEAPESVCRFDDFWRTYKIGFDPSTGLVTQKRFHFKLGRSIR